MVPHAEAEWPEHGRVLEKRARRPRNAIPEATKTVHSFPFYRSTMTWANSSSTWRMQAT